MAAFLVHQRRGVGPARSMSSSRDDLALHWLDLRAARRPRRARARGGQAAAVAAGKQPRSRSPRPWVWRALDEARDLDHQVRPVDRLPEDERLGQRRLWLVCEACLPAVVAISSRTCSGLGARAEWTFPGSWTRAIGAGGSNWMRLRPSWRCCERRRRTREGCRADGPYEERDRHAAHACRRLAAPTGSRGSACPQGRRWPDEAKQVASE